uniref:Reverse transcriptase zinc-binding domain-containing protein n=1 Tax=Cannabis sativa TaxID=3483 RepID=A0A803PHR7_CANSA
MLRSALLMADPTLLYPSLHNRAPDIAVWYLESLLSMKVPKFRLEFGSTDVESQKKANLQSIMVLSTTNAEYMACTEAVKEVLWLKGRALLIHSVLLGLRNYWMSIFILPHSITKEIEKLCRGFLWGWNGNRSKLHVASWEKVCLPKNYGGLGFKDGVKWNQAILAKYIWAISTKSDILWVKWVNNIYLKNNSIWTYDLKNDSSWYWRKLCHLRDKFTPNDLTSEGDAKGRLNTKMLYNSKLQQAVFKISSSIWNNYNMPKHRFIFWQAANDQLLTRDILLNSKISLDSVLCPVCRAEVESNSHLFFACCLSQQVSTQICIWLGKNSWPTDFSRMAKMVSEDQEG